MFRHDGIFELVVEGAFNSVNWRDWVWSDGCSQDWIEMHAEVRRVGQSYIFQTQFPIVFFESTTGTPLLGYDTNICISEGLEWLVTGAPTPHGSGIYSVQV
jgi:hypothetical protein